MSEDERETFEERAAFMEYDGGMSRAQAEAAARALILGRRTRNRGDDAREISG